MNWVWRSLGRSESQLCSWACCLLVSSLVCVRSESNFTVRFIHTNDIHARVFPCDGSTWLTCWEESDWDKCVDGVARRATMIDNLRVGNSLLLDAGDQWQGTLFFSFFEGSASGSFMNLLQYDAACFGNHEFDLGENSLSSFLDLLTFPVVSANTVPTTSSAIYGKFSPFVIAQLNVSDGSHMIRRPGDVLMDGPDVRNIGIIGYITEDAGKLSFAGPEISFGSITDTLAVYVAILQKMGIYRIIALSHAGLSTDSRVASEVDGISLIVGGHSHTLLGSQSEAAGPSPKVVLSPSGAKVLIVQAYQFGKYVGKIDVTFNGNETYFAEPLMWNSDPVLIDSSTVANPLFLELARNYSTELENVRKKVVGSTSLALDGGSGCRSHECYVADAFLEAMRWQAGRVYLVDCALMNAGGFRAALPEGTITLGGLYEVSPFANELMVIDLLGADLKEIVKFSVDLFETEGSGGFLQYSALRVTFMPEATPGDRLVAVDVYVAGSYVPLDDSKTYTVVLNDFIFLGGDGFDFSKAENVQNLHVNLKEAVEAYLSEPITEERLNEGGFIGKRIQFGSSSSGTSLLSKPGVWVGFEVILDMFIFFVSVVSFACCLVPAIVIPLCSCCSCWMSVVWFAQRRRHKRVERSFLKFENFFDPATFGVEDDIDEEDVENEMMPLSNPESEVSEIDASDRVIEHADAEESKSETS